MDSNPKENIIEEVTNKDYEFGFVTDIETDMIPKGLNEDIIRLISKKKEEPEWLLDFRLKSDDFTLLFFFFCEFSLSFGFFFG